jgi:hypothetical protein
MQQQKNCWTRRFLRGACSVKGKKAISSSQIFLLRFELHNGIIMIGTFEGTGDKLLGTGFEMLSLYSLAETEATKNNLSA